MRLAYTLFVFLLLIVQPSFTNAQFWSFGQKDIPQTPPGNGFRGYPWGTPKSYIERKEKQKGSRMIHESFEKGDFIQYEVTISDDIFGLASFYFNDRDELVASMCHNLGFHNMYNPKIFEKRILELYNQLVSIYGKPYKRYIDNYSRDEYIYFRNRTNHVDLQIAHNHHNLGFGFSISSIPEWNKQQRIEAQKEAQRKNPALKKQGL